MAIKHAFTSTKDEGADATKVRASNWNADHTGTNDHDHTETGKGGTISHTALTDKGSNTHAQIDTHISTFKRRVLMVGVFDKDEALVTGDGKAYIVIPAELNGMNLVSAHAGLLTARSSSGTPTIQIHNVTDAVDMLSTRITIDANEWTSYTAAVPPVIDTTYDDVATGDILRIDEDVAGTGALGLYVILGFE